MFLTKKGHLYSFGYGVYGQLGHGNSDNLNVPTKVKVLAQKTIKNAIFLGNAQATQEVTFVQIALGSNHSLALSKTQDVYVCGANDKG
jgi:alpha-tubulin suppressor-like RCC1 family protein